jgi:hypothetical protein
MRRELDAAEVAARLAALRALYVAERVDAAHARLAREQPVRQRSLEAVAAASLAELRALCELARALHAAGRPVE